MKKELGIFLVSFIVAIGLSGAVAAVNNEVNVDQTASNEATVTINDDDDNKVTITQSITQTTNVYVNSNNSPKKPLEKSLETSPPPSLLSEVG